MSGARNGIHLIKEETLMELFNLIFNMKEREREREGLWKVFSSLFTF